MTLLASDGWYLLLPPLLCAEMAPSRLVARPSWRKKRRCPTPHRGAVLNSSPLATPCEMSSARPAPMPWRARSEYRLTGFLRRAATVALPVKSVGVWHRAHPTFWNSVLPLATDTGVPGPVVDGVGGARNLTKAANFSGPLSVSAALVPPALVVSFGTVANWQLGFSSRSCEKTSLVMPCSTL